MSIQYIHGVPLYEKYVYNMQFSSGKKVCVELFEVVMINGYNFIRYYDLDSNNNINKIGVNSIAHIELLHSNDPKDFGFDC